MEADGDREALWPEALADGKHRSETAKNVNGGRGGHTVPTVPLALPGDTPRRSRQPVPSSGCGIWANVIRCPHEGKACSSFPGAILGVALFSLVGRGEIYNCV